ncbi:hypothetical protein [Actinomyces culturomici]|uniref:hypothetical protein n=1 Tax=Actinomyces culturomici TaxID=1926276 RepID=UPI001F43FFB4|nr:hypothetical protein [Actinomyces culturomici]
MNEVVAAHSHERATGTAGAEEPLARPTTRGPSIGAPARLARGRLPFHERLLVAGSLADFPEARSASWDPDVLRELAGADRVGEIPAGKVSFIEGLDEFAQESRDCLQRPSAWGRALGHRLRDAVEPRCPLWLSTASPASLPRLSDLLGEGAVAVAGAPGPDGSIPVALNPLRLVEAWSADPERAAFLRRILHDADSLRAPRAVVDALRRAGVAIRERSRLARLAIDPRFLAYLVVFVYSALRALPVALVPGFTGRVWVLWTIDVVTAIPYTWGVLAMVAGRTVLTRIAGLVVTVVTFLAPYVYFMAHGKDCPPSVLVFVGAMIIGAIGLEAARWRRDVVVARELVAVA